jgi:hypothetical protein
MEVEWRRVKRWVKAYRKDKLNKPERYLLH